MCERDVCLGSRSVLLRKKQVTFGQHGLQKYFDSEMKCVRFMI